MKTLRTYLIAFIIINICIYFKGIEATLIKLILWPVPLFIGIIFAENIVMNWKRI